MTDKTDPREHVTDDGAECWCNPVVIKVLPSEVEVERLRSENERLRARLRVIRRTVESERGRNLDADRVVDRVAAWVDEALAGDDQ